MSQAPNKAQRSSEGQENLLQTSTKEVARQAFFMKRAVDKNELKTVLKHAAGMLNELRTGLLLPKSYYDLYILLYYLRLQHWYTGALAHIWRWTKPKKNTKLINAL